MRLVLLCFTRKGCELAKQLNHAIQNMQVTDHGWKQQEYLILQDKPEWNVHQSIRITSVECYVKCKVLKDTCPKEMFYLDDPVNVWAREQFGQKNAIIFIGAVGIAVRSISGCVKNKLNDSPVLVIDEQGKYVIPILSGHMGGANELAEVLADLLGAVPVITTATDLREGFAIDLFAKNNCLEICNKDGIAKVTAKVLEGEEIIFAVPRDVLMEYWNNIEAIAGQGCIESYRLDIDDKKGKADILLKVSGAKIRLTAVEELSAESAVDVLIMEDNWNLQTAEPDLDITAQNIQTTERNLDITAQSIQTMETDQDMIAQSQNLQIGCICNNSKNHNKKQVQALLYLAPKEYVIGIGCKRGETAEALRSFICGCLQENGIPMVQVAYLASIDVKKEEAGLLGLSEQERIPFLTFSADELNAVEGEFSDSEFVKEKVGVGNVCERAAVLACGAGGRLICKKQAEQGKTIAIAKRNWIVRF